MKTGRYINDKLSDCSCFFLSPSSVFWLGADADYGTTKSGWSWLDGSTNFNWVLWHPVDPNTEGPACARFDKVEFDGENKWVVLDKGCGSRYNALCEYGE